MTKYLYVWETLTLLAMLLVNLRGILFVADRFYQAFILKRRHNSFMLKQKLFLFFLSMVPIIELRGAIPLAWPGESPCGRPI